jgi:hypothetical protein
VWAKLSAMAMAVILLGCYRMFRCRYTVFHEPISFS